MRKELDDILSEICEEDLRYREEAYEFVLDALSFSQKKFKRSKHVTGKELLEAVKIQLMDQFGPMALTVLGYWGIDMKLELVCINDVRFLRIILALMLTILFRQLPLLRIRSRSTLQSC